MQNIIIAGGTGLIGSALRSSLIEDGYHLFVLTRSAKKSNDKNLNYIQWDPAKGYISPGLPSKATIINLAGAPIAGKRWSYSYKELVISSRIKSAQCLEQLIKDKKVQVNSYIGASAIGIYGNGGNEWLAEDNPLDENRFIVKTTQMWEESHRAIQKHGIRTVILRIGLVLSPDGGVLPKLLMTSRIGIYNYFGTGNQWQSWIHIEDMINLIKSAFENESFSGVYNAVAPKPVRLKDMVKTIKEKKSGFGLTLPVPKILLDIGVGEMSNLLMDSARVSARKAIDSGYRFKYEKIETALDNLV